MLDIGRKEKTTLTLLLMGKVCNKSPEEAEDSQQLKLPSSRTEEELSETGVRAKGAHKEALLTSMDSSEFSLRLCPAFFSNI